MKLEGKIIRAQFGIKPTFQLYSLDVWPCPICGRDKMEFIKGRTFGFCSNCSYQINEIKYRKWWRQFSFWSFANELKAIRIVYRKSSKGLIDGKPRIYHGK